MKISLENKSNLFNSYRQAQEYEKKRIAAELHDTSLQSLAHLTHQLELASLYIDKDVDRAKLEIADINMKLKGVIDEIRGTIYDLRPMSFDDLSLKAAIEQHILEIERKSSNKYNFHIDDIDMDEEFYKLELFRCIQECINNCEKHLDSRVVEININVESEDFLHIVVSDNGEGFDVNSVLCASGNHFGLKIIKDRVEMMNGSFNIESSKETGTKITIDIPFVR